MIVRPLSPGAHLPTREGRAGMVGDIRQGARYRLYGTDELVGTLISQVAFLDSHLLFRPSVPPRDPERKASGSTCPPFHSRNFRWSCQNTIPEISVSVLGRTGQVRENRSLNECTYNSDYRSCKVSHIRYKLRYMYHRGP
jgi:hypothetical protein